ncbi:MAG: hypothetical protein ACYSUN_11340 [Planctomycetota bacterium]|jgi:hypothetical protein
MARESIARARDYAQDQVKARPASWGALLGVLIAAIPATPTILMQHSEAKVQQERTAALSQALHEANVVIGNMSRRYHEVTMALIAYKAGTEGALSAHRAAETLLPPEGEPTMKAWQQPEDWGKQ